MTTLQRYNGLDSIATFQLWNVLQEKLASDPAAAFDYRLKKSLSAPLLYAMMRGLLVDQATVTALRSQFEAECRALEASLDLITRSLGMGVINLNSTPQKIWMFETLGATIPTKYRKGKGSSKSVDRESLESISKADPELVPLCDIILAWTDRDTMLGVLQPELTDADGRMRTGYKVAGTKTDRLSSSKNALWTGMNMQNIKRDEKDSVGHANIRSIFVADPGCKFLNVDLERADSWAVALEVFKWTGDRSYLNACSSKDLHTHVAKLVWPGLGWTDDEDANIALAKQFFYRQYDYRFMCKKGGHGSNYLGGFYELARQMKIPRYLAQNFQHHYFKEFKGIPKWHKIRARHLQQTGSLTNLLDRTRRFHSRLDSDDTLKKAIAFLGQSVTAGVMNRAIINFWRVQLQMPDLGAEFLAQVHDSALIQFPEAHEQEVIQTVLQVMNIPITVTSPDGETVTYSIPLEASTGWNWAGASPANPDGQRKIKPGVKDDRQRQHSLPTGAKARLMDRRLSSVHGRSK